MSEDLLRIGIHPRNELYVYIYFITLAVLFITLHHLFNVESLLKIIVSFLISINMYFRQIDATVEEDSPPP